MYPGYRGLQTPRPLTSWNVIRPSGGAAGVDPGTGAICHGAADHTLAPLGLLLPNSHHGDLGSWTRRHHPPQALPALGMTSGGMSQQGLAHGR